MQLPNNNIIARDLACIWHPCSQMKDYETFQPLIIREAAGSYLTLNDGSHIIDAISSWWCKSLGHAHPRLQQALFRQVKQFEHVILANTTNETIVKLSEKLATLTHTLKKIFYAGDGSSAVEIAMKMSLQARYIQGQHKKINFLALNNAYHGETLGALSASDVGLYRKPYENNLFKTKFISGLPYVTQDTDPLWQNCEVHWQHIEKQLLSYADSTTAILVEPILQGAGGMLIYSQDFLARLRKWTLDHDIHLIADEIMTGIGRTGKMFACEHAHIEPDFLCLSKGLTSGWMAFSAVLTRNDIYDIFYADYTAQKSFLHSHTYSGNALAASIALEVLTIFDEENMCDNAQRVGLLMREEMVNIANNTGVLKNVRQFGAMVAADLILSEANTNRRVGFEIYQAAVKLGALLRPLGNTLYWLPPLNTDKETIKKLAEITEKAIIHTNTNKHF